MDKLTDYEREDFIKEITDNWDKWKAQTNRDELAQYIIDKAFTSKSLSSLKIAKDKLREIVIKGEEQVKEELKNSPTPLSIGNDVMGFLEDIKQDMHKEKFNVFVKKFATSQINKISEKITNENLLNNLGFAGGVIAFILVILELAFKHGYKDLRTKVKELRSKKLQPQRVQENDKNK